MKTAITLSLLPSRPSMPFVLGPELEPAFELAAKLGFDAIELFPPSLESVDSARLAELCSQHSLSLSTIGTGGGAVAQGLTLTDPNPQVREQAFEYIRGIIEFAGDLGGCAIVGSMQGKAGDRDKPEVLRILGDALATLGEYALKWDQVLLYEPLNRYESDLVNRLDDAVELLTSSNANNTRVLADLFHMNIEEVNVANALQENIAHIGHVHFVDSNRWPAGAGHTDFTSIIQVLNQNNFDGYLAVESFPLPNQQSAAESAAAAFSTLLKPNQDN